MVESKSASVGLIIGARDNNEDMVLLAVRSPTKLEEGEVKSQSYAGLCQVTSAGKLKPDELALGEEGFSIALRRKVREELGAELEEVVSEMILAADSSSFALLNEQVNSESGRVVRTYGLNTEWSKERFDALVKPAHEIAGFRPCRDPDSIQELEKSHKSAGVPANETRMFPDEKLAVQRFFERFYRPQADEGEAVSEVQH